MKFINWNNRATLKTYPTMVDPAKGDILYFHGGGFIFGENTDLPSYHTEMITKAGYNILAFNYPLAPEARFTDIIEYVFNTVNSYVKTSNKPYFLWGRSAGAYLSLLVTSMGLTLKPQGIISYYGYGLLVPDWYNSPSQHYLTYPLVDHQVVKNLEGIQSIFSAPINPRFLIYLYARQTGTWLKTISSTTEEDFLENFSLKNVDFQVFPPVLLAHSKRDTDVPYEESLVLHQRIKNSTLLTFQTEGHDFDKKTDTLHTFKLLKETIRFLDANL